MRNIYGILFWRHVTIFVITYEHLKCSYVIIKIIICQTIFYLFIVHTWTPVKTICGHPHVLLIGGWPHVHMWVTTYDCRSDHIWYHMWLTIYELSYVWTTTYELPYMNYHIWTTIYELPYMNYCVWMSMCMTLRDYSYVNPIVSGTSDLSTSYMYVFIITIISRAYLPNPIAT